MKRSSPIFHAVSHFFLFSEYYINIVLSRISTYALHCSLIHNFICCCSLCALDTVPLLDGSVTQVDPRVPNFPY